MISYIEGKITDTEIDSVIIETGGIGYQVFVANSFFASMITGNDSMKIYIYHHFREDGEALYGFLNKTDRELFKKLISVSGIGPKVGLSIMSGMSSDRIISAILNSDEHLLSTAQGVGKKTAARIILELHSKIAGMSFDPGIKVSSSVEKLNPTIKDDIFSALISLGYSSKDIQRTLSSLTDDDRAEIKSVESGIKIILQKIK